MGLGDAVESALNRVGISKAAVEKWAGKPCGCKERQEKLNALGAWAAAQSRATRDKALGWLASLTGGTIRPEEARRDVPAGAEGPTVPVDQLR